jgi:hypothetical protein
MSPGFLLTFLVAGLLALLPVWRLHRADWPVGTLFSAWVAYALGIFVGVRFPAASRILLPIVVLAFVAPFVAGPERLSRVLGGRRPTPGVIIDVTPRPAPGLPPPERPESQDAPGSPDNQGGETADETADETGDRADPG